MSEKQQQRVRQLFLEFVRKPFMRDLGGDNPDRVPELMFSRDGLSGLKLWGNEARCYHDALYGIRQALTDGAAWSAREAEVKFQEAVLRALDINGDAKLVDRKEREQQQAKKLATSLWEPAWEWTVHVPVLGLLPLGQLHDGRFGYVER